MRRVYIQRYLNFFIKCLNFYLKSENCDLYLRAFSNFTEKARLKLCKEGDLYPPLHNSWQSGYVGLSIEPVLWLEEEMCYLLTCEKQAS